MSTTLMPYLTFDGNTRQAFAFYEKVLDGKIKAMWSYDNMPAIETPDAVDDAQASCRMHLQRSTVTYLRAFSIITGRHPLQHPEASVEVGDVIEPHGVADISDLFFCGTKQLTRMCNSYTVQILAEAAARSLREIVRKRAIAHADEIGH